MRRIPYFGGGASPEPEEAPVTTNSLENDVELYRRQELTKHGMQFDLATELARQGSNWRQAVRLIEQGCNPSLAFDIARE